MNNPLINPGLGTFFWMLISFGVLAFILGKWGWPMLLKSLKKRRLVECRRESPRRDEALGGS